MDERAAEERRQLPSELVLEPGASGSSLGLEQPFEGGAVLEESGCTTGIARVTRGGGLHAACIGVTRLSANPWRE